MPDYLDYAASTPIDQRVLDTMISAYTMTYGNADSRTHVFGTQAKELLEKSRKTIADILQIDKTEVIFTSGATESDNIAVLGMQEFGKNTGKTHIITTAIEHKAVLAPMEFLQTQGFEIDFIKPDYSGRIAPEDIIKKIKPETLMVSVMHVNNETGVVQPVEIIGEELNKRNIFFHVDAAQSFGKLNESLRKCKYDMLSISSHKINGPQGIGALILRRKQYKRPPVKPLFYGGPQEYSFRPGTTPVPLAAGFAKAAELAENEHMENEQKQREIKRLLLQSIEKTNYQINGEPEFTLPGMINISFDGIDSESFFTVLKEDYAFSNGAACNSGSYKPSYVLQAMGIDEKRASEALRISWGNKTPDFVPLVNYVFSQQSTNC